jgi:predicted NBD/HSP70 family sugar kinase
VDNHDVRSTNEGVVLNLIRERQPISRADLARATQLRESTISSIVKALIDDGLVCEAALGDSSGGRRPTMLRIRADRSVVVGVDVDYPETTIGVSGFDGKLLYTRKFRIRQDPFKGQIQLADEVRSILKAKIAPGVRVEGIGVCFPGLIDPHDGRIIYSSVLNWRGVSLRDVLGYRLGHELLFEESVRAAGVAELWFGSLGALLQHHIVNVLVKQSLGVALIVGGHLYRGAGLAAGQFGHVSIDPDGPQCPCGNRGCWERYVCDSATVERYIASAGVRHSGDAVSVVDLVRKASDGDERAAAALRETAKYLGVGLATLVNGLNPEIILIDGEISQAWELIEPELRAELRTRCLAANLESLQLRPSSLRDSNPCVMGAIALVLWRCFNVRGRPAAAAAAAT